MNVPESQVFVYQNGQLYCEGVALAAIAKQVGTPAYVYSWSAIREAYSAIDRSLSFTRHTICYAMKANSSLALLKRLGELGSGADIVSGGELKRALHAGIPGERIVFSGVGKTDAEIESALVAGVRSLHAESAPEIQAIEEVAKRLGRPAPVSLRVNPDVDPKTHPYIATGLKESKFGIDMATARALLPQILNSPHLRLEGLACHIGSLIGSATAMRDAVRAVGELALECKRLGADLHTLDAGGGWPIAYGNEEQPPEPYEAFGAAIREGLELSGANALNLELIVEPGRSIVGDAGVLLTQVLFVKEQSEKRFVIVDGAMSELIRPALYDAYHALVPVTKAAEQAELIPADVVGPICESGDFLALNRPLPALTRGDLIAVRGAGAYGASMASNYNSRPRAPEVLVDGATFHVIRRRENVEDLWRDEVVI